jgi:peptidoglycan/xylan/chitin deacetylase (PgdA/CDA1 family)
MCRPSHRSLTLEEVFALAEEELIELGAHTVTHPVLSSLPEAAQRHEILMSKRRLQDLLNRPVSSFSYPYGQQAHYTAETVKIVRQAKFSCGCCNFVGVVNRRTVPFQLPRLHVRDCDGDEVAHQLSWWFDT